MCLSVGVCEGQRAPCRSHFSTSTQVGSGVRTQVVRLGPVSAFLKGRVSLLLRVIAVRLHGEGGVASS